MPDCSISPYLSSEFNLSFTFKNIKFTRLSIIKTLALLEQNYIFKFRFLYTKGWSGSYIEILVPLLFCKAVFLDQYLGFYLFYLELLIWKPVEDLADSSEVVSQITDRLRRYVHVGKGVPRILQSFYFLFNTRNEDVDEFIQLWPFLKELV